MAQVPDNLTDKMDDLFNDPQWDECDITQLTGLKEEALRIMTEHVERILKPKDLDSGNDTKLKNRLKEEFLKSV